MVAERNIEGQGVFGASIEMPSKIISLMNIRFCAIIAIKPRAHMASVHTEKRILSVL